MSEILAILVIVFFNYMNNQQNPNPVINIPNHLVAIAQNPGGRYSTEIVTLARAILSEDMSEVNLALATKLPGAKHKIGKYISLKKNQHNLDLNMLVGSLSPTLFNCIKNGNQSFVSNLIDTMSKILPKNLQIIESFLERAVLEYADMYDSDGVPLNENISKYIEDKGLLERTIDDLYLQLPRRYYLFDELGKDERYALNHIRDSKAYKDSRNICVCQGAKIESNRVSEALPSLPKALIPSTVLLYRSQEELARLGNINQNTLYGKTKDVYKTLSRQNVLPSRPNANGIGNLRY